jgi:hypothetical protein
MSGRLGEGAILELDKRRFREDSIKEM